MDETRRVNPLAVVCVVVALLLPVSYVAGYFGLSTTSPGLTYQHRCRIFFFA